MNTAAQERLTRALSIEAALKEAVEYLDEILRYGENVNGGDVVEWMAEWRVRARAALDQSRDSL